MRDLEVALSNPEQFSDLQKVFPRTGFDHVTANIVRQVIATMKDSLHERSIPLRLRLEPPHDSIDSKGNPLPPQRLIVRDGDMHFRIPISCHANAVCLGDRVCVTSSTDNPVTKVAAALAEEILKVLGFRAEASSD